MQRSCNMIIIRHKLHTGNDKHVESNTHSFSSAHCGCTNLLGFTEHVLLRGQLGHVWRKQTFTDQGQQPLLA